MASGDLGVEWRLSTSPMRIWYRVLNPYYFVTCPCTRLVLSIRMSRSPITFHNCIIIGNYIIKARSPFLHDGTFKLADPRAHADGHGNCADHVGNARDAPITAAAQALVHVRVPPCLWLHLSLASAWVPTDGTRDPTCSADSAVPQRLARLPARDHARAHAIIARKRAHGSKHADRTQQTASARPLDTPAHALRPKSRGNAHTTHGHPTCI